MTTTIRLTLKLYRFEIAAVLLTSFALAAAALVVAKLLDDVGVPLTCFASTPPAPTPPDVTQPAACSALLDTWSTIGSRFGVRVLQLIGLLPIGAGLLLGAPVLARELERGTAPLPWTLSGSRRRWLLTRTAILGAVLLIALVAVALASERLEASWTPTINPAQSFLDDNYRGPILLARGLASFGLAILAGLVLGRQLPAIIVGFGMAALLVIGALMMMDQWYAASAVYEVANPESQTAADRFLDLRLRASDGSLLTYDQAAALAPSNPELPPGGIDGTWLDRNFTQVWLLVPGERYPDAVLLHCSFVVLGGAIAGLASLALVRRRRPT